MKATTSRLAGWCVLVAALGTATLLLVGLVQACLGKAP